MASYKIIIDHTKVAANLTDFPVYIDLANFPQDFWDTVTNDGGDIRCYDVNDNELAREVVSCDTTLKSGELHVKANLSSTVPTILKISIDGTSTDYDPTDTYGRNAVWSNGYISTWHMQDTSVIDSSGDGFNGTAAYGISNTNGIVYGAQVFAASAVGQGISFVSNMPLLSSWTIQIWVKANNTSKVMFGHDNSQIALSIGSLSANWLRLGVKPTAEINTFGLTHGKDSTLASRTFVSTPSMIANNQWYYVTVVADSNELQLSMNGAIINSTPKVSTDLQVEGTVNIGISGSANWAEWYGGVDEVRISDAVRPPGWISTEYNNQSSPTTFYTVENIVQAPIPYSDGYAYVYENVGFNAPNSGQGYGYSYENVGYGAPNSGDGYGYSYENVGYNAPNSGVGYGYSYENVTIYVIDNDSMFPPIIS